MNNEKFTIEVTQNDVQNLINCYEKDIEKIKQLELENKILNDRILFLNERENKLQMIEMMFKNEVDLKKLAELVKGDSE